MKLSEKLKIQLEQALRLEKESDNEQAMWLEKNKE